MSAHGDVVVLTGATSGIGRVAARGLAADGWTVAAVGRDRDRGRTLERAGDIRFHRADLARQSQVRELASDLRGTYGTIDVLAHNAGISVHERTETPDGIELTLAVNHLAPYLLTHELVDVLLASAPARVVVTTSTMHERGELPIDDLQSPDAYDAMDAYATAKLASAAFTLELAERLPDAVTANCLHPGFIPDTNFFRHAPGWMRLPLRVAARLPFVGTSTQTGARRLRRLIEDPRFENRTGVYVDAGEERSPAEPARDPGARERLWEKSAELVGIDPDWP